MTRSRQPVLAPCCNLHRIVNKDRADLGERLYPHQVYFDHLTLFSLFNALDVYGDA